VTKKQKAIDWREKRDCFICKKELKKTQPRFMVAFDGWHKPINMYIHRRCYDRETIKSILESDEKRPGITNFNVY
jgi:hypothetical protein